MMNCEDDDDCLGDIFLLQCPIRGYYINYNAIVPMITTLSR